MTAERFYRGSNRSPFRANYVDGALNAGSTRGQTTLVSNSAATDVRLKRLAVTCMLPKDSTGVFARGWLAFLRVGANEDVDITGLNFDDPKVLRPKVWITNPDHAIYLEMYLEAVNLAPEERILLLGYCNQSFQITYAAKWYSESSIH